MYSANNIQIVSEVMCQDLDEEIDRYIRSGYRMAMILPSDAPREVLMTRDSEFVKLKSKNRQRLGNVEWATGRAGMMYRDLVPNRMGGKLIASHIRIVNGSEVPDSVHYHKIDFQVIYCVKGAIKVVYEDQGLPFWLHPDDCVLQPPEIRHRVLEAEAGSEVIEITSPAEHETWFDYELELPTAIESPVRLFGNQRFAIHRDEHAVWCDSENGLKMAATNMGSVGPTAPHVNVLRSDKLIDQINVVNDNEVTIMINGHGLRLTFVTSE